MNQKLVCQKIKCSDCLTDDGEPVWCYRTGCPANVAVTRCPKALGVKQITPEKSAKQEKKNE